MQSKRRMLLWSGCVLVLAATTLHAQAPAPAQGQTRSRPQVYGSQLMTPQERNAHRARMAAAHTYPERDQIRAEHHARMQARARERGLSLPDSPRKYGYGDGVGPGRVPGMGPGMGLRGAMGGPAGGPR